MPKKPKWACFNFAGKLLNLFFSFLSFALALFSSWLAGKMNPKNNFRFKPHIYENQLSPFGKIVLKNLIKIRENKNELIKPAVAEQMKYSNHVFVHNSNPNYRNKKILNFREEKDVISSSELLGLPYHSDYPDKVCSRGNESHNNLKRQSPEMELLAFPDAINDSYTHLNSNKQDYELYSTNKETFDSNLNITSESRDLLASKLSTNDFVPKILEDTEFDLGFFNNDAEVNNDLNNASGGIVWNDIVDTQLFDDNNNLNSEKVEKLQNPVIINENLLQMRTPLDADIGKTTKAVNNIDSKSKKKKKQSKVKTPDAIPTSSKRKCAKITDSIPKKIKKPQNSVMAFPKDVQRKKKTNTNVQNWLDEMDPDNLIEEGSCEDILTINKNVEKINDRINIGFDSKPICNKKKVQAQLTNKDGIMKYDKPKNSAIDLTNDVDKVTTETKVTTQKKSKLKFVVPIKSQVPVKEIVYDIFNIDCNSVINRSFDLRISGSEVFMVLTYSNGFNQLNGQFTEDVCLPEAMMLLINDNFYYLKGKDFNIMDDIAALVKKNSVICYGGKSVLKYLAFNFNIDVYEVNILDLKIGGSLMDPDNPPENFSNLQKLLGLSIQYTIANDCSLQKAAWYLTLLKEATPRLTSLLKENSLWKVFIDIEMAVMPIIASMEIRGIVVDSEKLQSMEANILSKIKKIEQDCYKAAGKKFQINSTVQVRAILYDELQLDTKSNVKIKETVCQGAKSTSETMLRSLTAVHPLPKLILDYRQLHKAHATFLVGISQQVKDGLLRPTWEQTAAATGRIAANNPNIQAIPKAEINLNDLVEGDQDAAVLGPQQLNFRSIYTSRPGFILLAADFNHVECRVFAHAAADESLLELLATGRDLFRVLASKWLNKSEESITSEDRERTKRIVYASLYGAGARKLTDILGVSYDQALTVFSSFNRTFPSLKSFGRSVVSRCSREGGSLSTLCGRVRRFANIDSSDATLKAQAERQAVNFIVQGSAADLCKLAMVSSVQHLRTAGVEAHLLLQIHDELVWEIRQEQLHIAAGIIKSSMEECGVSAGAGGTLPVTLHTGQCWGYMTTYNTH